MDERVRELEQIRKFTDESETAMTFEYFLKSSLVIVELVHLQQKKEMADGIKTRRVDLANSIG